MGVGTGVRATSLTHPGYALDPLDRRIVGWLVEMGLWSQTAIAHAFGVSRRTVSDCHRREFG